MRRFSGKTYWLVGASEGLGRALALALSKAGAEVIVSARNAERLQDLVDELPGPARAVACDVADPESVAKAAAEAGPVDGLVFLPGDRAVLLRDHLFSRLVIDCRGTGSAADPEAGAEDLPPVTCYAIE